MRSSARRFSRLRVIGLGLGALAVASAGLAGGGVPDPGPVSVATVGELLAAVLGQPAELQNYFVIPVAGHVEGYNGTEFRTDVTILAAGPDPQRVAVAWLAQGMDSSAQELTFFEVGPEPVFFADMVANTLDKLGLGALVVAAVAPDGSLDAAARLTGFARAWTPVSGCSGTASLAIEASRFTVGIGRATGLLLDAGHRGTVGIVNPNAQARTWTVYLATGPIEISLPAASMRQVPQPQVDRGPIEVTVIEEDSSPCPSPLGCRLAGYAASIDQTSGDGWLVSFTP